MTQQISITTGIVLGFLVFLLLGGRLIRYFGIAAEGKLDIGLLFSIIGYNLPYFLELILPLSFFIALMLVFGRLYVDHEMAVINSSGLSRGHLARLAMPLIILLFLFESWLSIVGKPWGVRNSDTIWQKQAMKSAFDLIKPGEFIGSGNYHLYVGSLNENNSELRDVILIQTDVESEKNHNNAESLNKHNRDTIVLAKRAKQVEVSEKSSATQLDLFNGRRYEIGANSQKYNQIGFDRYRITLNQSREETVDEDNVETKKIETIWQSVRHKPNINKATVYIAQAEFGYRLALPWLMILAPMMAVPLSRVRPRQGRWLRLIPAILLFVIVALGIISLKKPVAAGKVSVWSYLWLVIGLMIMSLYLNWASRINQRVRFGLNKKPNKQLEYGENH